MGKNKLEGVLTDEEKQKLVSLGKRIVANLGCNANGDGFPCRTCRFAAMNHMEEYLITG